MMEPFQFHPPKIRPRDAIYIIGISAKMSLAEDKTEELWRNFGPRKKEIVSKEGKGSYSIQVYDKDFFKKSFSPRSVFVKWAGISVKKGAPVPHQMRTLKIDAGLWAVFFYKGESKNFGKLIHHIFTQWLPQSGYSLDNRPQFEYLTSTYKGPNHPDSEEEFWLPIIPRELF